MSFDLGSFSGAIVAGIVAYMVARYQINKSFEKQRNLEKELFILKYNLEKISTIDSLFNISNRRVISDLSQDEIENILNSSKIYMDINLIPYNKKDKEVFGAINFAAEFDYLNSKINFRLNLPDYLNGNGNDEELDHLINRSFYRLRYLVQICKDYLSERFSENELEIDKYIDSIKDIQEF